MGCVASCACRTVNEGEWCAVSTRSGKLDLVHGPRRIFRCGRFFKDAATITAAEDEYLVIKFRDGHTEFKLGPATCVEHPVEHSTVRVEKMQKLYEGDVLAVYREAASSGGLAAGREVQRELLEGPCMYVPQTASEWVQKVRKEVASEGDYLLITHLDGKIQFAQGPTTLVVDPQKYSSVEVKSATKIGDQELIVVYRKLGEKQAGTVDVQRHLIKGPRIYIPESASEWTHRFSWTGNADSSGGFDPTGRARKKTDALKFEKLRTSPGKLYFDVESVRTKDNASITVRLMIFFCIKNVEQMLDESSDPFGDMINAVSADVIEWCSAKTFDEFLAEVDKMNTVKMYAQLTAGARKIGLDIEKVVFRGYEAPPNLQKMHDGAIERRTQMALARESEEEEQKLSDFKLEKEMARSEREYKLSNEKLEHELELEAKNFEAKQSRARELLDSELAKLRGLKELDKGFDFTRYLIAKEGPVVAPTIQCSNLQSSMAGVSALTSEIVTDRVAPQGGGLFGCS